MVLAVKGFEYITHTAFYVSWFLRAFTVGQNAASLVVQKETLS